MRAAVTVDQQQAQIALGEFGATVSDRAALLRICGELMRSSVELTFREEGSPAGSWPALAASTLKRKGYTAGHKLLILSGRLFSSITYDVSGDTLTIGTGVVYAAVQQFGSRDYMSGAAGPRTREQIAKVDAYESFRMRELGVGLRQIVDSRGRSRRQRTRVQGPQQRIKVSTATHTRRQNIPPRPFLVFRPEDPDRLALGIEAYLGNKAAKLGKVGSA